MVSTELDTILTPHLLDIEVEVRKKWNVQAEPLLLHWLVKRNGLTCPAWWPNEVKNPLATTVSMRKAVVGTDDLASAQKMATQTTWRQQPWLKMGSRSMTPEPHSVKRSGGTPRTVRAIGAQPRLVADVGKARPRSAHLAQDKEAILDAEVGTANSGKDCKSWQFELPGSVDPHEKLNHNVEPASEPLPGRWSRPDSAFGMGSPEPASEPHLSRPTSEEPEAAPSQQLVEFLKQRSPQHRPATAGPVAFVSSKAAGGGAAAWRHGGPAIRPATAMPLQQRCGDHAEAGDQPLAIAPVPPPRHQRPLTARRSGRPSPHQQLFPVDGGAGFGAFGGKIVDKKSIATAGDVGEMEIYGECEEEILFSSSAIIGRPAPVLEEPPPSAALSGDSSPSSGGRYGLRSLHALQGKVLDDAERQGFRHEALRTMTGELQDNVMHYHLRHHEALINRIPVLSRDVLTAQEQFAIINKLTKVHVKPGAYICREGDPGDWLYIVEAGTCEVVRKINGVEAVLGQLRRGSYFGERAVFFAEPRNASVRAVGVVHVLTATAEDIQACFGDQRVEELRHLSHVHNIAVIPGFLTLTNKQRLRLARRFTAQVWAQGQAIAMQGETARRLYAVEVGEATLVHSADVRIDPGLHDTNATSEVLCSRQYVGVKSLFLAAPLPITVIARSSLVRVLSLGFESLWAACREEELDAEGDGQTADDMLQAMRSSLRVHLLRSWELLAKLPQEELERLLGRSKLVSLERWSRIVTEGDIQDSLYFLEEGTVVVSHGATSLDAIKDQNRNQLHVSNLPHSIDKHTLHALFSSFGTVWETKVTPGETSGFVTFATRQEAQSAVEGLDKVEFNGSKLSVNFATMECSRPGSHFGTERWADPYSQAERTLVAGWRSLLLRVPKTALREALVARPALEIEGRMPMRS